MRYTFGVYTLDTQRYELYRADIPLQLQPKVCDLLAYLLQYRDRVVTRQELFDALWPGHFVSDDALEWVMASARRAVGDSGRAQRVIKTIRNRGYRWMVPVAAPPHAPAEVEVLPPSLSALVAEQGLAVPLPGDGERKPVTVLTGALAHTEALTEYYFVTFGSHRVGGTENRAFYPSNPFPHVEPSVE
jgi:DNA-binding winged helix-turn-helix (wHTH) protein